MENLHSRETVRSTDGSELDSIVSFRHGLVGLRTQANVGDFSKPLIVVYYNVDYNRDAKGTNYIRNRILKVAKTLANENINVRFAISNPNDFRQELGQYGITDVKKDAKYVVARGTKDEKYLMSEDFR